MLKTESFIRARIHYHDFLTGLVNALNNGIPNKGIDTDAIFTVRTLEVNDKDKSCFMMGRFFECIEFLTWTIGTYDAKKLKEMKSPEGFQRPTKFSIENWDLIEENKEGLIDINKWQLTSTTIFDGVEWLEASHSGDGGDRCCAGVTKFNYKTMCTIPCDDGRIIEVPDKYLLNRILKKEVYKGTILETKL